MNSESAISKIGSVSRRTCKERQSPHASAKGSCSCDGPPMAVSSRYHRWSHHDRILILHAASLPNHEQHEAVQWIAETLGVSAPAVQSQIWLARQSLGNPNHSIRHRTYALLFETFTTAPFGLTEAAARVRSHCWPASGLRTPKAPFS